MCTGKTARTSRRASNGAAARRVVLPPTIGGACAQLAVIGAIAALIVEAFDTPVSDRRWWVNALAFGWLGLCALSAVAQLIEAVRRRLRGEPTPRPRGSCLHGPPPRHDTET